MSAQPELLYSFSNLGLANQSLNAKNSSDDDATFASMYLSPSKSSSKSTGACSPSTSSTSASVSASVSTTAPSSSASAFASPSKKKIDQSSTLICSSPLRSVRKGKENIAVSVTSPPTRTSKKSLYDYLPKPSSLSSSSSGSGSGSGSPGSSLSSMMIMSPAAKKSASRFVDSDGDLRMQDAEIVSKVVNAVIADDDEHSPSSSSISSGNFGHQQHHFVQRRLSSSPSSSPSSSSTWSTSASSTSPVTGNGTTLFSPVYPANAHEQSCATQQQPAHAHAHAHHKRSVQSKDPKQRSITEFTIPSPKQQKAEEVDPKDPWVIMSRSLPYEYVFDACDEDDFNPLLFIKTVPPLPYEYRVRSAVLPRKTRSTPKLSLVLDLDETLVHCSTEPMEKADLTFHITSNGVDYTVYARKRPHMDFFLREVSKIAEVTVFTASQQVYAEKLLDLLDPKKEYIKYRLYRPSCVQVEGLFLKDLSLLGRDLASTVIVDNSPQAFAYQVENGIPIDTWIDQDDDTELVKLLKLIREEIIPADDVRNVLRRAFRIQSQVDELRLPDSPLFSDCM
eukprot:ANDGO_08220.mRNA.1 CTD small phosphatase-like protein 2